MSQTAIPYLFLRGGSSRGPYFHRADLPQDRETLSQVLIALIGAGHPLNIDGIGGGEAVTTKVAMLSPSDDEWADIDYFFAQVAVDKPLVDYRPTCGNILSGVGPAAIEMGLVRALGDITEVKIHAVNTGAKVIARVHTPGGMLRYDGDTAIAGVPGTAAPIALSFLDVVGSVTSGLLPTGRPRDTFQGVEVTCIDVAMPLVIARASDLGLSGNESAQALNDNAALFATMEAIRLQAARAMGLGDASESVIPKFAVLAPAQAGGSIAARYFMPWRAHPSMAVSGAQCIAACALLEGSVADGLWERPPSAPLDSSAPSSSTLWIEHPSGMIDVMMEYSCHDGFVLHSAGLVRSARKLAAGEVFVPHSVWSRK